MKWADSWDAGWDHLVPPRRVPYCPYTNGQLTSKRPATAPAEFGRTRRHVPPRREHWCSRRPTFAQRLRLAAGLVALSFLVLVGRRG